jgi:hypothetical protein
MDLFEKHKALKASIGNFITSFSVMEYALGIICTFTEFDLIRKEEHLADYLGMTLDQKKKKIGDYINKYEPELSPIWSSLKSSIDVLNKNRRFIAHGIQQVFVDDNIVANVRSGRTLESKVLTKEEIDEWTDQLNELNSGSNGIVGSFYIDFVRRSVNRWNQHVKDELKIKYLVNDQIVTDWTGPS